MTPALWLKDVFEKSLSTFLLFGVTLLAAGTQVDISFAHTLATAGVAAVFVVVLNAIPSLALPASPPWMDVAGRAAKSFLQALIAIVVAAGSGWLDVSVWQAGLIAGIAAAASVIKGSLAIRAVPDSISPASLAKAA